VSRGRTVAWILVLMGVAGIAVAAPIAVRAYPTMRQLVLGVFPQSFDREAWKQASGAVFADTTRLRMIDDLLEHQRLIGSDVASIEALLGPPDRNSQLVREQPQHGEAHVYRLGPDFLDSMWLIIEWDSGGRVASTRVRSD